MQSHVMKQRHEEPPVFTQQSFDDKVKMLATTTIVKAGKT